MTHKDTYRGYRGGSWYFDAQYARAAQRYDWRPGDRDDSLGFRLVSTS